MESNNASAQTEIYNQGVFSSILLPINDDYLAVNYAIRDLMKEGWKHDGIIRRKEGLSQVDNFYVQNNLSKTQE